MTSAELDIKFREAVARINAHKESFPADILLKLYAYYKKPLTIMADLQVEIL